MARSRNIKPSFFDNDLLAECQPLSRLLFIGLWCIADREGRLEDRPKRIRKELLGYDDCDCDDLLEELHNKGFIERYEIENNRYIQIINFTKHQNPHHKENESLIPASDKTKAYIGQEQVMPHTDRADSLNPLIDSLNPIKESKDSSLLLNSGFDEFWSSYPKKKSKGDAEKAWKAIKPSKELVATILKTVAQAKTCLEWQKDGGQFIPYPATWLRAMGWEDEYVLNGGQSDPLKGVKRM